MRFITLLFSLLLLSACEPIMILPGGQLDGAISPPPADWAFTQDVKTIQLETNSSDPYSVNIWLIATGSALYVHAGKNRAAWVEHMEADPNVRIRIADKLYELRATRVTSADEFSQFANAYEKKYDRRPRNENVSEAYLFRLTPRS